MSEAASYSKHLSTPGIAPLPSPLPRGARGQRRVDTGGSLMRSAFDAPHRSVNGADIKFSTDLKTARHQDDLRVLCRRLIRGVVGLAGSPGQET